MASAQTSRPAPPSAGSEASPYAALAAFFDAFASQEQRWRRRNRTYHRQIEQISRFQIPPGLNLAMQGITEGPLWDKVVNSLLGLEGPSHQRLRSLVSKAFTPRAVERLHATIVDMIDELVDGVAAKGQCDIVETAATFWRSTRGRANGSESKDECLHGWDDARALATAASRSRQAGLSGAKRARM